MKTNDLKTTKIMLISEKVHDIAKCKYYTNYYVKLVDVYEGKDPKEILIPVVVKHNSVNAVRFLTYVLEKHCEIINKDLRYDEKDK